MISAAAYFFQTLESSSVRYKFACHINVLLKVLVLAAICVLTGCALPGQQRIEQDTVTQKNAANVEYRVIETTNRMIKSFDTFLTQNRISSGAIAVSYNGKLVGAAGKNRSATEPARIASLSKAITAVCLMKALENSGHTVNSTLETIIPGELRKKSSNIQNYRTITIEELLTHTSGIRIKHLSRQGREITRYGREQKQWQLDNIIQWDSAARRDQSIHYANANYLILGIIIEALTNTDYESYCMQQLFTPLGITSAKLSPRWRILSSYGGWEISATDYLLFANTYFNDNWKTGLSAAKAFTPQLQGSSAYGLGVWMRSTFSGTSFWHSGSISWRSQWQNANFGSYFSIYNNGFSVSVNYSKDGNDGRGSKLRTALNIAAGSY